MKLLATPALLVLGLAVSSAPASAQHDPPFVARGLPLDVAAETGGVCRTNGGADMWPDGRSVVTWIDGVAYGNYRILSPAGGLLVDGYIGTATSLDVSTAAYGGFASAFTHGIPGQTFDLQARIFDPQEVIQLPQSYPIANFAGSLPAVAAGSDGRFVVAWAVAAPTPAIVAARFDRAGNRIGGDVAVAEVAGSPEAVDVTRAPDGSFTVYWRQSATTAGSLLHLRRFGADGAPLGDAVAVGSNDPRFPRAAGAADGDAVLVYVEDATAALMGRLLAADGTLGEAFPIFAQAANPAVHAQPAFLADGSIAAAAQIKFGGGPSSIHLLRFGRDGQPLGQRISVAVPTVPGREFVVPQLASSGDRIAVYYARQFDGNGFPYCSIVVRFFDATLFADGFESGDTAAWAGGT